MQLLSISSVIGSALVLAQDFAISFIIGKGDWGVCGEGIGFILVFPWIGVGRVDLI